MSVNLYAYTYPWALYNETKKDHNGILIKFGDSHRDPDIRMSEQGGASEALAKIKIATWLNVTGIKRDYEVHRVLKKRGLQRDGFLDGKGTEWFSIPVDDITEIKPYLDNLLDDIGGAGTSLLDLKLRKQQKKQIDRAMAIVEEHGAPSNIVANLCPRFGKTLWALELFNRLSYAYDDVRVMVLPAYWLSVHSSFKDEIGKFKEFQYMDFVTTNDADPAKKIRASLKQNRCVVLELSLCGEIEQWKESKQWPKGVNLLTPFIFADEADFGSHTDKQVEKMRFLFGDTPCINVFSSGTNIQRIAKNAGGRRIHGYLDTAYTELEGEKNIVKRNYYAFRFNSLYEQIEDLISEGVLSDSPVALSAKNSPIWSAIWAKPHKCESFISTLFRALVAKDDNLVSLSLNNASDENISGIMVWCSANNAPMKKAADIIQKAIPDWKILTLNGNEGFSNKDAQERIANEIMWAKQDGYSGFIILSNMMGSRSFSIPEIQANVIMYDNGSVDMLSQRTSRCLTPGSSWDGVTKEYGHIVSFSFDDNRCENIENLVLYEAITLARGNDISFTEAVKRVARTINIFNVDYEGELEQVTEGDLFTIYHDNDNLLKVADVTVDVAALLEMDLVDTLMSIKVGKSKKERNKRLTPEREGNGNGKERIEDLDKKEIKALEKILNTAIRVINRSAADVFNIAGEGDSFSECLDIILNDPIYIEDFEEAIGISPALVSDLVDKEILNLPLLDVVVANTKIAPSVDVLMKTV